MSKLLRWIVKALHINAEWAKHKEKVARPLMRRALLQRARKTI